MAEGIQPEVFDLIVLGTGLQESLIAGAAALSGLSVLHVDEQQHYGSHWAGLTLDQFLAWAKGLSIPSDGGEGTVEDPQPVGHATGSMSLPSTVNVLYTNVKVLHATGADLGNSRQYNIDLAPKVLYTVGPVVEALLRCKAEDYLSFKLIQSCAWKDETIVSVAASRADVFMDRTLAPGDKRILMRFLKNAVLALNGDGPLKDGFDERPFCELLSQQGLPPHLQSIVLYSLAMLDTDQSAQGTAPSVNRNSGADLSAVPSISPEDAFAQARISGSKATSSEADRDKHASSRVTSPSDALPTCSRQAGSGEDQGTGNERILWDNVAASTSGRNSTEGQTSSSQGLQAISRYLDSVSRYGGAFMTPDYACGELPQAFCRVAAVHGAVYVLRCRISEMILDASSHNVEAVRTAAGQVLKCRAIAGHADALKPLLSMPPSSLSGVSRTTCITDAPLQQAAFLASERGVQMLLTVPPGSLGGGRPTNSVRVLQLGSQTLVAPPGRFLLHVSTPLRGTSSSDDVASVIAALTQPQQSTSGMLQPLADNETSNSGKPRVLLRVSYDQATGYELADDAPSNVALTQPPDVSVGYAAAVADAEAAFKKLFPDRKYLPVRKQEGALASPDEVAP